MPSAQPLARRPAGSPRPTRHVSRLVPAPLPAEGPAPRAAATPAPHQPCALPAAPLPARLGLQLRHRRRLAPPGRPARAQPGTGPLAALERRLRRVSARPQTGPRPNLPPPRESYPEAASPMIPPGVPCWRLRKQAQLSEGSRAPDLVDSFLWVPPASHREGPALSAQKPTPSGFQKR